MLMFDSLFMMEMVVENGWGYIFVIEYNFGEYEIGIILIDVVYSFVM